VRPARISLALFALLAVVLAGCAASGGTALDARTPADAAAGPGAGGDPLFARAVAQTREAGSFRFEVSGRAGVGDRQVETTMRGAIDPAAGRASISTGTGERVGLGAMETIVDGGDVYLRLGPLVDALDVPTPWARVELGGLGAGTAELPGLVPGRPDAMLDLLDLLAELGAPPTEVERVELGGVSVRHLRAEVSIGQLLDQLPADDRDQLRDRLDEQGFDPSGLGGPLRVDLWSDDDDLLHRIRLSSEGPDVEGAPTSVEVQLDILDHGEPVDIALPPADEVTDLDLADLFHR